MKDYFTLDKGPDNTSLLKTIRMRKELFDRIEQTSIKTNLSMNKIMNECIKFALDNLVLDEDEQDNSTSQKN